MILSSRVSPCGSQEIVYDPRFQDMLFLEQTRREQEANRLLEGGKIKVWLCDRTIIDNLAYIRHLRKIYSGDQDPESVYPIKGEWLSYIKENPFDLILLCDPDDINFVQGMNIAWESDKIEDEIRIRSEIHDLYLEVLTELGVAYKIISGTPEIRATYVEGVLQENGISITREGAPCQPEGEV